MMVNVAREVAALQRLTIKELRGKFAEVFGDSTLANNRQWLVRRIVWRIQALAEGDLSERARRRAEELANDADLRVVPPPELPAAPPAPERTRTQAVNLPSDGRLPPPGTLITRAYKGETVTVQVLADGFEYAGEVYRSLSAVAKAVTGSHCNGYLFFKLGGNGGER
jgi:Protein of unknown function (DUF2924)